MATVDCGVVGLRQRLGVEIFRGQKLGKGKTGGKNGKPKEHREKWEHLGDMDGTGTMGNFI